MARPDVAQQTRQLINRERRRRGRRALRHDPDLQRAAQARASDMAAHQFLQHASSSGAPWYAIVEHYVRLPHLAENIAEGFDDPASLVAAWMASPEHRRNILDRKNRRAGLAWARAGSGAYYQAHEFGG